MAWRDRTNLYISYRSSYAHYPAKKNPYATSSGNGYGDTPSTGSFSRDEHQGLMSSFNDADDSSSAIIEMDRLPPRWADISDEVAELLAEIATKSQKLERLHQKHVLPGFDDEDVKKKEEREIEDLTQQITRDFHACQKAIQRVEILVREGKSLAGGLSRGEETMAKNIQVSLATKVQEASAAFRKKQSSYMKKLKSLNGFETPSAERSTNPAQNPYTDPSMLESESDRSYSHQTLQSQQQQKRLSSNNTAIALREREINDIAQGIIELADIFKELQSMIIDQGTMLDRIDYNVERMAVDVKGADKELGIAQGYQKKTLKRKIILLLILLVVGMFILLLVKPRRKEIAVPVDTPGEGDTGLRI